MKSMLVTFLTTFIGDFVGIYVVKFFFFHGNSWGVSDTVYCLVLSFLYGAYFAYKNRNKEKNND